MNSRAALVFAAGLAMACAGCGAIDDWLLGEPESRRQYLSVRELYEDGRYQEAAVGYRAWLADYHDSQDLLRPFVMYQLGECHRLMRDYGSAAQVYSKLVELYRGTEDPDVLKLVRQAQVRLEDITPRPADPPPKSADKPKAP